MKRFLLLVVAAFAVTLTTPAASTPALDQATAKPGAQLSALSAGQHLFGEEFDSKAHRGDIVVVNIGGA